MPRARSESRAVRLGVFGGTFDPPHLGHLALAERAAERLALERVMFVPAARPPHKRRAPLTPARHRLAMVRLAVRGNPRFAVSDLELRRAGPSYTVDTLRALHARHPRARLHLLLGADSLVDLPNWREADAIRRLATLVVAVRPGAAAPPARGARVVALDNPGLDVASHALRATLARGGSARYLVPDAVLRYAARHRLYARAAPRRRPRPELA
jgi:nicotinate-nucleotide adenylyltransferase